MLAMLLLLCLSQNVAPICDRVERLGDMDSAVREAASEGLERESWTYLIAAHLQPMIPEQRIRLSNAIEWKRHGKPVVEVPEIPEPEFDFPPRFWMDDDDEPVFRR